jgi:hypothetical protein
LLSLTLAAGWDAAAAAQTAAEQPPITIEINSSPWYGGFEMVVDRYEKRLWLSNIELRPDNPLVMERGSIKIVSGTDSSRTLPWRKADSNSWSRFGKIPSKTRHKVPCPSVDESGTLRRGSKVRPRPSWAKLDMGSVGVGRRSDGLRLIGTPSSLARQGAGEAS